jgi:hypothetical protein
MTPAELKWRRQIGKLVRMEKGKSQVKMGDAMTFSNLLFEECVKDPDFLARGLERAVTRLVREQRKRT